MVSAKKIKFPNIQLILLTVLVLLDVLVISELSTLKPNDLVASVQYGAEFPASTTLKYLKPSMVDRTTVATTAVIQGLTNIYDITSSVTETSEDELSNDIDNGARKSCLIFVTNPGEESNYTQEDLPDSRSFVFGTEPNSADSNQSLSIINVAISYVSAHVAQICLEFLEGFREYVTSVVVRGENFYKIVKPDDDTLETKVNRCSKYNLNVTITYRTGQYDERQLFADEHIWQYPIRVLWNSPNRIDWSYPKAGLECIKQFRVDADVSEDHHWQELVPVRNIRGVVEIFNVSFWNISIVCNTKNVTITPIYVDDVDGKSLTLASVLTSSIDPKVVIKDGFLVVEWKINDVPMCIESYLIEEWSNNGKVAEQNYISQDEDAKDEISVRLNADNICILKSIIVTSILIDGSRWKTTLQLWDTIQHLSIHQVNKSSVQLNWNVTESYSSCVKRYKVFEEGDLSQTWHTATSNLEINDLEPCKNYTFVVVPIDRDDVQHISAKISVTLSEQHISEVQYVQLLENEYRWKLPAENVYCLSHFLVIQTTTDGEHLLTNSTIDADISDLSKSETNFYRYRKIADIPCALYANVQLSIIPVSRSYRLGDGYDAIVGLPRPGPVHQLRADTSVERQITLSWSKPIVKPECTSLYRISYEDRNITVLPSETTVTIQNLNACVEYNFTVAPVDFAGEDCEGVTVNATVKEEKLSGVEDLELVEVDPRSLMAKWKPPVNGTFCVASYRYVAWVDGEGSIPEQISNSTTDLYVTFVEVYACTKYNVQVIPVSKGNNDGNNRIEELQTKERVILRYHIDPVRVKTQYSRSLELQTALTSDNNNMCQLFQIRFTCTTNNVPEGEDPIVIIGEARIIDMNATFSAIVSPLTPYNEYNCTASILNKAGWSDESSAVNFMTGEDFPEQPRNLQLVGGYRMMELRWTAPRVKNGIITRYRVHVRSEGARYPNPSYCPEIDPYNTTFDLHEEDDNTRVSWNDDELDHRISSLNPYTDYVVQVAAATKAGLGPYTEMVSVSTLSEKPEPVLQFEAYNVTLPELDKPYNSTVTLTWQIPCNLNGRLRNFTGRFVGIRNGLEHTFDWNRIIESGEEIRENYSFTEATLEPEFLYNASIMISVDDVADRSDAMFLSFESPAGIPEIAEDINWGTVSVMNAPNPTQSAMISLSDIVFEWNVGSIQYVALMVSERQCQEDPSPQRNLSKDWPDVLSWRTAVEISCTPQYQTTPRQWNPVGQRKLRGRSDEEILFVIGSETCETEEEFCNGPLKPGTEYALIVRVFTNSGYSDSTMQIFRTDALIQLTVIIVSIFACLLLAFSLGLVILWRKQKLTLLPQTMVRSPNDEPADIPLKSFSGIYEELVQSNRDKINKEYQAINFFSDQLINEKVTFTVAKENERKNRYLGIFPYDSNRVPLEFDDILTDEDEEVNDYINASFINGYKYQREYIATQGPKKETCFDFWRMILQYEVESIVMLTQTVENDRIKCYQYFPKFNQTLRFKDVSVKCTQELNLSIYQKRLFLVTRKNLTRPVFHYHFLAWPDHGCPASASDLIKFIKIIRSERKNLALPVVVHCSAGVGRTGTLIALDIILQRIQHEKKINIYETVKQLRNQRVKMVQTSEQYAFLYHACLEYTTRNNRKKPNSSDEETTSSTRSDPNAHSSLALKNGRRNMINIKFPKYVHSGISNVKSYVPDDVQSST
ncbi:phosphatidylinositol phosphatase PTPRQ [Armigeres subalbatus]|uniref:phosphatidylinositol phosphatase PTPRQ n=1 Tax=Armigeres subalbatus TaxID=124917 RepID=UPI002ED153A9